MFICFMCVVCLFAYMVYVVYYKVSLPLLNVTPEKDTGDRALPLESKPRPQRNFAGGPYLRSDK